MAPLVKQANLKLWQVCHLSAVTCNITHYADYVTNQINNP